MKTQTSILNLQEVIRKTRCNTLVNSGVIEFVVGATPETGTIQIRGKGKELLSSGKKGEDKTSKVDGSMSFDIRYPATVTESGETAIANLADLLSKTEMFAKEDPVTLSIQGIKLIIDRELPKLTLEYDLADKKFIASAYKDKTDCIFGSPITLVNAKGEKKEILFTSEIVMDSSQLKTFADIAQKIEVIRIPLEAKDGKLLSAMTGKGANANTELRTDKCVGNAISTYGSELIEIFKVGFGLATLRFANDSIISIHYELNNLKTNYMLAKTNK